MRAALEVRTTPSPPAQSPHLPGGRSSLPAALGPREGGLVGSVPTLGLFLDSPELLIFLPLALQTSSAVGCPLAPKKGNPAFHGEQLSVNEKRKGGGKRGIN